MEVCVGSNALDCQDISSVSGFSADLSNSSDYSSGYLSVNGFKTCLSEFVSVEGIEISTSGFNLFPGDNDKCNVVREEQFEDSDNRKMSSSASEKCFSNPVTFPAPAELESSVDGLLGGGEGHKDYKTSETDESAKSVNRGSSQSGVPSSDASPSETPLKLVSAMKGSREKQGNAPKMLSVIWAPDVYDPTPASVSHVPSSKNQRYHNKGKSYGKNKHKNAKSSRGSKGKDKKQARKNSSLCKTTV